MNRYEIRSLQARCAALGVWPGPIDGIMGARTRAAYEAACLNQKKKGLPFQHPSGITRLHAHWTGGGYVPNASDRAPYHFLITGQAEVLRCHDDDAHLAHTLNANGGAIGISICAMAGAKEVPFEKGAAPVQPEQMIAMAVLMAKLCRAYDIPISRYSVLMHSEIQPTLGIPQKKKWDLNWQPGMDRPADPLSAGDKLRAMVVRKLRLL